MTFESLERLRLFVGGHRQKSLVAAQNARRNGYLAVALDNENEAQLAKICLEDLANEPAKGYHAKQKAHD